MSPKGQITPRNEPHIQSRNGKTHMIQMVLFLTLLIDNISVWPYWSLAILVFGQMPNQMLDSRTKVELFGGCSLLKMQETSLHPNVGDETEA